MWLLRHWGRLPWCPWGDSKKRQGGPWAPPPCGVHTSGMLLWFLSGFCFWLLRSLSVLCEAVVLSQGSVLFSGPLSPSRPDPCLFFNCLSSSFFSLSGAFVDAVSLSLSLSFSLSGAGETQAPCGVWVSPCVLCIPAANFVFYPYSVLLNFPKASPRTCFVFFSRRSIAVLVFFSCLVLSVLVVMVGVCCGR